MKKRIPLIVFPAILLSAATCRKSMDAPPVYSGPQISANLSVRQLRNMHFTGGFEKIMAEYVISGIVVANDSSDNFYKTIVLQDSTAGITIRLDGTGLYSSYPVGRQLFIRLKDLWLGDYAGMVQLGGGVDRSDPQYPEIIPIPQPLFSRYIIAGTYHHSLQPIPTTIVQLNDSLQSCLVRINDVEIQASDTGKTYADVWNRLSANRIVVSCSGARVSLRTSGFAGFAGLRTPRGNGAVTGIYSIFRNEKQLMIRDTSDVRMGGLRCAASRIKLLLTEDFESPPADTLSPARGWKVFSEAGDAVYRNKITQGNRYAQISAFALGQNTVITWLVSPPVDLSGSANEQLSFITKDGFDNGATLQVLVSTGYDGSNTPWKAKWVPLKAAIAKGSLNSLATSWVASGNISLDSYKGTICIAFRYEGADPPKIFDRRTTTFQLDNIRILGN